MKTKSTKILDFPPRFAKVIGKHPVHVYRIKHGISQPSAKLALAIYRELGGTERLTDIFRPSADMVEFCRIIVEEAEKS